MNSTEQIEYIWNWWESQYDDTTDAAYQLEISQSQIGYTVSLEITNEEDTCIVDVPLYCRTEFEGDISKEDFIKDFHSTISYSLYWLSEVSHDIAKNFNNK